MNPKGNQMEMAAICGLFALLSLWGIVWDFTSGLITSGIDGIMLLAICLMVGGVFSLLLLLAARQANWLKFGKAAQPAPSPPSKSREVAAAANPQPVERSK